MYSGLVGQISVDAGSGNDTIDLDVGKQPIYAYADVDGGLGNDRIVGVQRGSNVLSGGEGDDRVTGGDNNDSLYGGSGNDQLFGLAGNDDLHGDSGNDWLEAGSVQEFVDFGPNPSGTDKDWNAHQWSYNGATYDDVRQGGIGNCSFMAALSSAALRGIDLDSRVRYLGNFTYEVDLYNLKGKLAPQRVRFDGSGNSHDPIPAVTGEYWTILFRRAFLKVYGAIDNFMPFDEPPITLTGRSSTFLPFEKNDPAANANVFDEMDGAIRNRRNVTTGTWKGTLQSTKLVSAHAYTVVSVQRDLAGQPFSVLVRNPWGYDGGSVPSDNPTDGLITLSWVVFQQDMQGVCIN